MSAAPVPTVTVRLFAGLRERAGWAEQVLPLEPERAAAPTPAALWRRLGLNDAGSDALPATMRVAVNQVFAAADQPLQPGDEVAFLPPISGG